MQSTFCIYYKCATTCYLSTVWWCGDQSLGSLSAISVMSYHVGSNGMHLGITCIGGFSGRYRGQDTARGLQLLPGTGCRQPAWYRGKDFAGEWQLHPETVCRQPAWASTRRPLSSRRTMYLSAVLNLPQTISYSAGFEGSSDSAAFSRTVGYTTTPS